MTALSVLVLAGGRSRRFGRDKLRLDWRGQSLVDHVVSRMSALSDDVLVLAARDARIAANSDAISAVRIVADVEEWPGPLVAIAAALPSARHEIVLVVAADMPLVPTHVLELLAADARRSGRNVTGLSVGDELQPLPVVVRRSAVSAAMNALVDAGVRRLGALRDLPGADGIRENVWRALDPEGDSLRDVDTEEDYDVLLART